MSQSLHVLLYVNIDTGELIPAGLQPRLHALIWSIIWWYKRIDKLYQDCSSSWHEGTAEAHAEHWSEQHQHTQKHVTDRKDNRSVIGKCNKIHCTLWYLGFIPRLVSRPFVSDHEEYSSHQRPCFFHYPHEYVLRISMLLIYHLKKIIKNQMESITKINYTTGSTKINYSCY